MTKIAQDVEPTCFEEAAENVKWQEAMNEEMDALYGNETWELVSLPKAKKPIGCRWLYKTYGIDYEETFAPVTKMAAVKAVIAMATTKGWILHQMDVKNAFLHGEMQEEVYMEQPQGFQDTGQPDYVCKLQKPFYGLKQAPRAWYDKITQYLVTIGLHMADADHFLYVQTTDAGIVIITIPSFIKKRELDNDIDLAYVGTEDQVADLFTKTLGTEKLRCFPEMLGLQDMAWSLRGSVEVSSFMPT
ncbi:hypothetical protein L7F22_067213 [Adiantum nelumboides]|nr:hypothetical protein [Adiantum nelumboides]